jgi:hypothetical protein
MPCLLLSLPLTGTTAGTHLPRGWCSKPAHQQLLQLGLQGLEVLERHSLRQETAELLHFAAETADQI